MNCIDVRNPTQFVVDQIMFSDTACLTKADMPNHPTVSLHSDGDVVHIPCEDIDHLIEALKKAKELWGRG